MCDFYHHIAGISLSAHARQCQQCQSALWVSFWVPLLRCDSRYVELIIVFYLKFSLWQRGYLFEYQCLSMSTMPIRVMGVFFWVPLLAPISTTPINGVGIFLSTYALRAVVICRLAWEGVLGYHNPIESLIYDGCLSLLPQGLRCASLAN